MGLNISIMYRQGGCEDTCSIYWNRFQWLEDMLIGIKKYRGGVEIREATAWGSSKLKYKLITTKTVISVVSIGSGASIGPS